MEALPHFAGCWSHFDAALIACAEDPEGLNCLRLLPVRIYHQAMPRVDPNDDSIRRWVLRHYRYDPHRRQRRHVIVAAFDNKREFEAAMAQEQRSLTQRQEHGGDPREHLTGTVLEPGDQARARTGRLVRRSIEHGVDPWPLIDEQDLPRNIARYRAVSERDRVLGPFRLIRAWLLQNTFQRP